MARCPLPTSHLVVRSDAGRSLSTLVPDTDDDDGGIDASPVFVLNDIFDILTAVGLRQRHEQQLQQSARRGR